ncbi:MAG: ATP-dependent DNA helicase UvrD2, partial [Bifidobacteriaceae bacterium]|jgi:DNA helicase-2/ATP-dependent DNA helicase PcrA|nr:ATP-dependent DNA helicase UvrD2 [Bifidobacteriaceae bacterium]
VARAIRTQYRHFVVDEYQDVSPLQQRLLDLWLGGRKELCVVGDPAQTIYSFDGATSGYLTGFQRRYPEAKVVQLVRDYRSTPQVVSLANSLLRSGKVTGVQLVAQASPGPAVAFRAFLDDAAEAEAVAARIRDLAGEGVEASEVAVLFRTNGQSEPVENALAAAGIPYQVRGGERFFSRREVRQALALLKSQARVESAEAPLEVIHSVLSGLGWTSQAPGERGAVRERWESLDALAVLAQELLQTSASNLPEVVALIEARAEVGHSPTATGVTLASLHSAKGLEWEAVFLIGLADGLVPISLAVAGPEVAEERRLLYVGVTRAKRHLQLSYAKARTVGGSANRRVSRFLNGIWPAAEQVAKQAKGLAVPNQSDLSPEEAARFDQLRDWRLEVARASGRPAFTVLTDLTLRALASRCPADAKQLAAIPGIGPVKIEQYGKDLLDLLTGAG